MNTFFCEKSYKTYNKMKSILLLRNYYLFLTVFLTACNFGEEVSPPPLVETEKDPYLTELYLDLNRSPMQEKLRVMKPFPVGVVYYQQRGHTLDSIRKNFQIIDSLGFTALKQVLLVSPDNPPGFEEEVFHTALDEGIIPWYYGKGGWIRITPEVMEEAGVDIPFSEGNMQMIQKDPDMIAWQTEQLHKRVEKMRIKPEKPEGMGEPGRNSPYLPERLIPAFARWLEEQYGSLEVLKDAWNEGFTGTLNYRSFMDAANDMKITGTDEFGIGTGKRSKDFRRSRDAMKFLSGLITTDYLRTMEMFTEWDPEEPERTGGHQIFENQPINGWDLEAQAKAAAIGGSFYSSIHLTHHFFLVEGEYVKPVYMQARTVADMFKGGWAATWESTGGPMQWSGMDHYTIAEGEIRQLMLSYIAAGLKGIGFWSWNSRGEGWETGEYALTTIQGEPSERAVMAGHISKILQEQRFELWDAMDEPVVGILYSWENEAMLGKLSMGGYPLSTPVYQDDRDRQFRQYHSQAKTGISRALINHNIPFEYVTERDLAAGLAGRYPVIYLPYVLALSDETLEQLTRFVEQGGILMADFPLLMLDDYGRLRKHFPASPFERLFGFQTQDYYHTFNDPKTFSGQSLETQFGDIKLTHATALKKYKDGTPSIISSDYGSGKTIVFNFELGRALFKPGNTTLEEFLATQVRTYAWIPFEVKGNKTAVVYRRSAPDADHYFVINQGGEEKVIIEGVAAKYSSASELISGKELDVDDNSFIVGVPRNSGVWIRCEKEK